jgi:hypothetical protein
MPYNKTTSRVKISTKKVEDLKGGTLVRWSGKPYVVLLYDKNPAGIGAVALEDGGYLTPDTIVEVIPAGEVFTITVGE